MLLMRALRKLHQNPREHSQEDKNKENQNEKLKPKTRKKDKIKIKGKKYQGGEKICLR